MRPGRLLTLGPEPVPAAARVVVADVGRSVGSAPNGPPPQALTWDGTDERGIVLTPGIYYYRGWLRDRNGLVHLSTLKPVEIEEKWLRGSVHPVLVLPGET
ncbi:MAG: hypothetical protein AB1645_10205, partial [Bacillota bacterium]